jgi:hypothetical protein
MLAGVPALLSLFYVWVTVITPFTRNGVPPGWDTGAYIGWVNSFLLGGFGYVQDPRFIQFSGANLSPLLLLLGTTSLTRFSLPGFVIFQLLILGVFFLSTFVLARSWKGSMIYTLLVFAFLITDPGFVRMTWGFYANLLTMAFLQFALAFSLKTRTSTTRLSTIGVSLFSTLMLVTDVEIGVFGIVVLTTSLLLTSFKERATSKEALRLIAPVIGGLVVAGLLWLPYAGQYLPLSPAIAPPSPNVNWSQLESDLGGPVLIPIWLAGVAYSAYQFLRIKSDLRSSVLLSWILAFSIAILVTLAFRPTLANRVAWLLPAYFLIPEAMRMAYATYRRAAPLGVYARPIGMLLLVLVAIVTGFYSTTTFAAATSQNASLPYLSLHDYQVLTNTAAYLRSNNLGASSTVFLIYPAERTSDPDAINAWTNLYDSWIFATVGPHLAYYGTVQNFTRHDPINFTSPDEKQTFISYSNNFASEHSQSTLHLVVVSFFYGGPIMDGFSEPLSGVYVYQTSPPSIAYTEM